MPSVEKHVQYCVKAFGKENEALCYQVNSWMDAPSRTLGSRHRVVRHDLERTIFTAIREFLSNDELDQWISEMEGVKQGERRVMEFHTPKKVKGELEWSEETRWKQKAGLITEIIIQHLMLDGLLTQRDIDRLMQNKINLNVNELVREEEQRVRQLKRQDKIPVMPVLLLSLICGFITSCLIQPPLSDPMANFMGLLLSTVAFSLPFLFLFAFISILLSRS